MQGRPCRTRAWGFNGLRRHLDTRRTRKKLPEHVRDRQPPPASVRRCDRSDRWPAVGGPPLDRTASGSTVFGRSASGSIRTAGSPTRSSTAFSVPSTTHHAPNPRRPADPLRRHRRRRGQVTRPSPRPTTGESHRRHRTSAAGDARRTSGTADPRSERYVEVERTRPCQPVARGFAGGTTTIPVSRSPSSHGASARQDAV